MLQSLGTVRAVAAAASMSPSAVSAQLAALEAESGVALLERHGRAIALAPAGDALAAHAVAILDHIGTAEEDLRSWHEGATGVVRVGAFTSALRAFVIDAARDVRRDHPGLRVHLDELEPQETVPALTRGAIDLAIVGDFGDGSLPPAAELERTPLATDDLLAVLPPGHRLRGASLDLRALRDEPWLLDGTDLERHVVLLCRRAGFEPARAGRLSSHGSLMLGVAAGLGVTVLPAFAIDPAYAVRTCRLRPAARRELIALTRAGAARRRSIAVTRDAIAAAAAALG